MKLFSNNLALSVIGDDNHVLYACNCKEFKPITKLYFCRHCAKLRCSKCVTHEVDSFYCPNCLENMPSAEAKLKRNRCANCFDCPSCGHTLSVRATVTQAVHSNALGEGNKATPPKKMHYLSCGFCRWTTRDVGLADQVTPSGGWPDQERPFTKKMTSLLEHYKQVTHQDKVQKERQKLTKRRTNMYLMDRYGYSISLGKKRGSFSSPSSVLSRSLSSPGKGTELTAPECFIRLENIEPISDDMYTQPVILDENLTLEQRLKDPAMISSSVKDLYPKHKHLMVRRSYRCKECEHNLCKPEFNPSSIKFKLQLFAVQYCPTFQIVKIGSLAKDKPSECVFSLSNPLDAIMNVQFKQLADEELGFDQRNADIALPTVSLPIAAKDATLEFDGIGSVNTDDFDDDPVIVKSRSSNKLCFYANVTPKDDSANVKVAFKLTYSYKMIIAPIIRKLDEGVEKPIKQEEQLVSLDITVVANLGKM